MDRAQLPRAGANVASRVGRRRQPEGLEDRLRALRIPPTTQAQQHPPHQPLVHRPGHLETLVRFERDLDPAELIAHALIDDREFLILQIHRAALLAPPNVPRPPSFAHVPGSGQRLNLLLQHVAHRFQADRDQRLDHCHPRAQILGQGARLLPTDKLHLALSADA
jgi:hypothetical protein